ncbi:hypothetical protein QIS74_04103 [Colletotrichum tabaci]|uniref:Acyltransferase 3 domain-containing protein n=1 Tax=Colletotrichum tabaci TaxID=1209068 RepID=A0AAV9TIU4_9PEZI
MQQHPPSTTKGQTKWHQFIGCLKPTFARIQTPDEEPEPLESRPSNRSDTAYLDGLRGIAAFIVFILHLWMPFDRTTVLGYGPGLSYGIFNLPILRVVRSGKAMVRIFFVISGYVLTLSPARHYLDGSGEHHSKLGKALIKRPFRLFLPPIATTLLAMLLVRLGAFQTAEEMEALPAHLPAQTIILRKTFFDQLVDWAGFVAHKLTNPWGWVEDLFVDPDASYYGAHLWTIQTEFRCSIITLTTLQSLFVLRSISMRYFLSCSLILFCVVWLRWDVALFLAGMTLCLLDVERNARTIDRNYLGDTARTTDSAHLRPSRGKSRSRFWFEFAPWGFLMLGLWAVSYPDEKAGRALGFGLASKLCDSVDFWQSVGALTVVWSVGRLRPLKRMLGTKWLQYLGALSYSLYLVHYPFLETVGWRLTQLLREYFSSAAVQAGVSRSLGILAGNVIAFIFSTLTLLWVSDYTWRALDKPCLRMLRWLDSVL